MAEVRGLHEAVIHEGVAPDRVELAWDGGVVSVVAEPGSAVLATAAALVAEGVSRIELCGGYGHDHQVRVVSALGERATVGAVAFGFSSLAAAAAYQARYAAGERLAEAFVVVAPGAAATSVARTQGPVRSTVASAPGVDEAVEAVRRLVDEDGVGLVERYGPLGPRAALPVIEAVGDHVAVGVVGDLRPDALGG